MQLCKSRECSFGKDGAFHNSSKSNKPWSYFVLSQQAAWLLHYRFLGRGAWAKQEIVGRCEAIGQSYQVIIQVIIYRVVLYTLPAMRQASSRSGSIGPPS